ncbi:MAG: TonB-dependent receptor [Bacteroidota bacterium]
MRLFLLSLFLCAGAFLSAQTATLRGTVVDADTGDPISFGTVRLVDTDRGANTDIDGFFNFADLDPGTYTIEASYIGYETTQEEITLEAGRIEFARIVLSSEDGVELATVNISSRREQARSDVQVSKVTVTTREIQALPSTGGEPDIAQYLSVLPGVISTGDQGGQLFIRGGSPIQNKVILDGMTVYNPFHSIGLFSVFETEAIRAVDVYTGGFNAEYGGRTSAIVDISTREGNKTRLAGLVSASPFQAKVLVEGPLKPLDPETGNSISFLLTGKHSYLAETSKQIYQYAISDNLFNLNPDAMLAAEDIGLPYNYTDIYGKLSIVSGGGSKIELFGFSFTDDFAVPTVSMLDWANAGGGASFKVVPPNSSVVINGTVSYSDYEVNLLETNGDPRRSRIANYRALLNFTYFGLNQQFDYGFEFNGFNTDFEFSNPTGITIQQEDFTTELHGYLKYKRNFGNFIIEPGVRAQFYASLGTISIEPRIGLKYNVTNDFRIKAAGGVYSQNLISTQNDLDIVNFFSGFLSGPEEALLSTDRTSLATNNLQRAVHGIAGFEFDLGERVSINVEGYYKDFTQLIELNRNKLTVAAPDFITLVGDAYGGDISFEYRGGRLFMAGNYSLGWVTREDDIEEYFTSFDRRHNVNLYGSYRFGRGNLYEFGARFNFGSAFPFTQTQGFFTDPDLAQNPVIVDVATNNGQLGVLLADERNGGRLADFHRLDISLKRKFEMGKYSHLDVTLSVTNAYNRENIFFVDRITNQRVDQLPILPALTAAYYW